MRNIDVNCTVLSPMFMHGSNKHTLEIRVTGLKAAMRFWWRAARQASALDSLRNEEDAFFGGVGEPAAGRAAFSIRMSTGTWPGSSAQDRMSLMPHHTVSTCSQENPGCSYKNNHCMKQNTYPCIQEGHMFITTITARRQDRLDRAVAVFELAALLGGVGQRSRRGFGAYTTAASSVDASQALGVRIISLLNRVGGETPGYQKADGNNGDFVIEPTGGVTGDFVYPSIREIRGRQTTRNVREVLKIIGQASHDIKGAHRNYPQACGSGNPRLASPVYISMTCCNNDIYVIITLLRSSGQHRDLATQQALIHEVMNNV